MVPRAPSSWARWSRWAITLQHGMRLPLAMVALLSISVPIHAQTTTRVSVATGNVQSNRSSSTAVVSADGRWVAFTSEASNLVPGDTNGVQDVFVHDRQSGTTSRVSIATGGGQGNGDSYVGTLSADGRCVVFSSWASTLVAGDTNAVQDVFVHDRHSGQTSRVSVGPGGEQANGPSSTASMSADCRWVAFGSAASNLVAEDTNGVGDVFLRDLQTGAVTLVSRGPAGVQSTGESWFPQLSADGRWVAFTSYGALVADDTNGAVDVFIHDTQTTVTTRASVGPGAAQGNSPSFTHGISADGRWVAFTSFASNLVPGDTNGVIDAFVHDRDTGTTIPVSVGQGGTPGNGASMHAAISGDGRWVAFSSWASNLVAGDTNGVEDAFVRDLHTATTIRVSVGPGGAQANGASYVWSISADGGSVVFPSFASNLVAGDTNGAQDVFVHDRGVGCAATLVPASASAASAGATGRTLVMTAAGCPWTAVSSDPSWLTVSGAASGTGFGAVDYSVAANSGDPRIGTIVVAGRTFVVRQESPLTPLAPADLVVHTVSGNVVTLRWRTQAGGPSPTGFVLEGGLYYGQVLASMPTGSLDPTFTFVAPTGSFYARLHALNGAYRSAASNEIHLHVGVPVPPSAPASVLSLVNGSNLALAWRNTFGGGAPTSFILDVTGSITAALALPFGEGFTFGGAPPGTYTLRLRAVNAGGASPPSNAVTVTFPMPCTGPPLTPAGVFASRVGRTVSVDWALPPSGPAPTSYVLNVSGAWSGNLPTAGRTLGGTVAPGAYTLSVTAVNWCGVSAGTAPVTVDVP